MSQKDIWRYIHIRWAGIIVHLCPFTDTRGVNGQRSEREKKSLSGLGLSARDNHLQHG